MDHRPFEDWLLDNQALSTGQMRQLNAHLRVCPDCTAIAEVNLALNSTKLAVPAAGFTERFQIRLSARKKAMHLRNFWGIMVLTLSALGILTWVTWPILKDLFQSPVNLLASWISSMASFWASVQAITQAGLVLFKVAPGFIPAYIWMVILFVAGAWSLVWVISFMKFTKVYQGVQK
jgi:hypothetical protein